MDIYQSLFSSNKTFNEQLSQEIFEAVPEQGLIIALKDHSGNSWLSDQEAFTTLNISESFLAELCSRVDDGVEPVITQIRQCSVVALGLTGEQSDYGYVILILPQYSPESTLVSINLIEMILNQINMIVGLLERNHQIYHVQMKRYLSFSDCQIASN